MRAPAQGSGSGSGNRPAAAPPDGLAFAQGHCEALVREGDPDRYVATLFAPQASRPHLFALYAFSLTIARVRAAVSNPMAGEIRLQWWRDALQGEARGEVGANPVAAALIAAVTAHRLGRQPFVDLVDARVFDLYDDPMPRLNDLEGYCGETASSLFRLASLVIAGSGQEVGRGDGQGGGPSGGGGPGAEPGGAGAAGHAGVAYGLTGLLRALPWHARAGQVYLPADLLAQYGVTREDIVTGRGGPGLAGACADLRATARGHLRAFEAAGPALSPAARTAFLPVALVADSLRAMERPGYDPLHTAVETPRWRRLWRLWRASRRAG